MLNWVLGLTRDYFVSKKARFSLHASYMVLCIRANFLKTFEVDARTDFNARGEKGSCGESEEGGHGSVQVPLGSYAPPSKITRDDPPSLLILQGMTLLPLMTLLPV